MTEHEWNDLKDRELDDNLAALFKSVEPPRPLPGFAARTMKAVRHEPLPAWRRSLDRPFVVPISWIALVTGVGLAVFSFASAEPSVPAVLGWLLAASVRTGVWLMRSLIVDTAVPDVFTVLSDAIGRAVATTEVLLSLALTALVGALCLAALNRVIGIQSRSPRLQPRH